MSELASMRFDGPPRFRPHDDWFLVGEHHGVRCTQVWAVAERLVDLFHALSSHLDPAVDVVVQDRRRARTWRGALHALPDVREVIGRLRLPLAAFGGVEFTLVTPDDQLSLTPELLLVIYARTTRWSYLLDGLGLEERPVAPTPVWHPWRAVMVDAPQLTSAVDAAVTRLGLAEVVTP
jgi:hypothetical protein